jgi:hypothetical protein
MRQQVKNKLVLRRMKREITESTLNRKSLVVLAAASALVAVSASATEYDLSVVGNTSVNVAGDVGGTAIVRDYFTQPAGTGIFEPFLTLDSNGQTSTGNTRIESGYNTDGFTALYLDQLRPQWNDRLTLGQLARINIGGINYVAFELDANEPGNNKSIISIDNIRVYTSATDHTAAVGNNLANLNNLGTLRWALNNPNQNPDGSFNIDDWVKLDSNQENVEAGPNFSNGGSGKSDMIVYIPLTAFAGALDTDYVWFYNLNGVHYTADGDLAAEAGYEEWRAVLDINRVPDGGSTMIILGFAMVGLEALRRRLNLKRTL